MAVVALGIDPATKSGWGIVDETGRILAHGVALTPSERLYAVTEAAVERASIAAIEFNTYGNLHTIRLLSSTVGRWLEQVETHLSWADQISMTTAVWRRAYKPPRWKGTPSQRRKQAKGWAVATANSMPGGEGIRSDDAAEACLIAYCGILRAWQAGTQLSQSFDSEPTLRVG